MMAAINAVSALPLAEPGRVPFLGETVAFDVSDDVEGSLTMTGTVEGYRVNDPREGVFCCSFLADPQQANIEAVKVRLTSDMCVLVDASALKVVELQDVEVLPELESSSEISFDVSDEDRIFIDDILNRAQQLKLLKMSRGEHHMDLCATHANGCPLDFERLAEADDFNFLHDFCGIYRHLNRETGKLDNHFRPRFARRETGAAS